MIPCCLILWLHFLAQKQTIAQIKTTRQRDSPFYEGLQGQMLFDFCGSHRSSGLYEQGPMIALNLLVFSLGKESCCELTIEVYSFIFQVFHIAFSEVL